MMLNLSLFSLLFYIVNAKKTDPVNITPVRMGIFLSVNLLKGYSFEKYFTSEKVWDGLPVFWK